MITHGSANTKPKPAADPAAILYLWNPTANTTGINVLDSISGGGSGGGASITNASFSPHVKKTKQKCDKEFEEKKNDMTGKYGTALVLAGVIAVITWETVILAIASGLAGIGIAIE